MEQNYITKEVYEQIKNFRFYHLSKEDAAIVDKLILNEDLKRKYKKFSLCKECYQICTRTEWCSPCISKHFQENFENWTSGNNEVDKLIKDNQLLAEGNNKLLEWIEYDKFFDVKFVARGGFGTVYKAKWKEGFIVNRDVENNRWKRWKDRTDNQKEPGFPVVLKLLHNSQNISAEYLRELNAHVTANSSAFIIQCYGMSKDPETNDFILVMDYKEDGSLRRYLDKNSLCWEEKLLILRRIANGLKDVHGKDLAHRDFHSGNILIGRELETVITDLGLSGPTNELNQDDKKKVIGVLPYLAPEVLKGKNYTKESDIYSFGIICYEVISGLPPHHDIPHDGMFALRVMDGSRPFRPEFKIKVPKLLLDLVVQCWDKDPSKRPNAEMAYNILYKFWQDLNVPNFDSEFYKQYDEADEYNKNNEEFKYAELQQSTPLVIHPKAVYKSRAFEVSSNLDLIIPDYDDDDE